MIGLVARKSSFMSAMPRTAKTLPPSPSDVFTRGESADAIRDEIRAEKYSKGRDPK
jgi:hypothetical protein